MSEKASYGTRRRRMEKGQPTFVMLSETTFSCQVRQSCSGSVWKSIQTPGAKLRWTLPSGLRFLPFRNPPRKTAFVLRSTTCSSPAWQPVERSHSICPMLPCFARSTRTKAEEAREGDSLDEPPFCSCFGVGGKGRESATCFEAERVIVSCQSDML